MTRRAVEELTGSAGYRADHAAAHRRTVLTILRSVVEWSSPG